jgi:hypothetical protein
MITVLARKVLKVAEAAVHVAKTKALAILKNPKL